MCIRDSSSLPFQLSFLNHRSRPGGRYSVNIPMQDDDYNSVRCEYVEMLENQIAKSNNGIVRTKLLTFGVNVDDLPTARARLERVEAVSYTHLDVYKRQAIACATFWEPTPTSTPMKPCGCSCWEPSTCLLYTSRCV